MRSPLLFFALTLGIPASCHACATVTYESGLPPEIDITDESALIVWDEKSGTEQFVREAEFKTGAKNFGFLVPTPSKPELSIARDGLFDALARELMPHTKIITQRGIDWRPLVGTNVGCASNSSDDSSNAAAGNGAGMNEVQVVEQKRVGDYNASVLRANDAGALTKWLRLHHYSVTIETRQWLETYIKKSFFLTAFQIAADVHTHNAQAKAVNLTFKTSAPFYPYREPRYAQKQGRSRTLRVFYVGNLRVGARVENEVKSAQWPAKLEYSAQLQPQILRKQGVTPAQGLLRLTAFEDLSSPRPAWGDLRFEPSRDQSEKTPPALIVYEDKRIGLPVDVLGVGTALTIGWRRRRSKRDAT